MEHIRRVRTIPVAVSKVIPIIPVDLDEDDSDDAGADTPLDNETPEQATRRIEAKYRARATSPLRAIRFFCVMCMGGAPKAIAGCTAPTCALYPFREGKNPYQKRASK